MTSKANSLDALKQLSTAKKDPTTSGVPDHQTKVTPMTIMGATRQMSVKVDMPTYDRLRSMAVSTKSSHQEILYDALREWLLKNGY